MTSCKPLYAIYSAVCAVRAMPLRLPIAGVTRQCRRLISDAVKNAVKNC